jgi:Leucine-rich repeat (LRR) protein
LFSGSLPDGFESLTELNELALEDNQLTGSIDTVWKLPKLKLLNLNDNDFTGSLPDSIITTSPLLIILDISGNNLFGKLPSDIFRHLHLEILDLNSNTLTGEIPDDINSDGRLELLALHRNQLNSTIQSAFGNLRQLQRLDLSTNDLSGTIPADFDFLTELHSLFLAENPFTPGTILTFFYDYDSLRELSLKSTQRTGTISPSVGLLDRLVLLDLDNNELTGPKLHLSNSFVDTFDRISLQQPCKRTAIIDKNERMNS